ncbi:hypothetical protein TRFO_33445 [Tritrichomonas foetus]|uniref:Protein kinase domain-containing protein n=1 Tax=Tritrichomonas foetus TaxID=1144522 RepID=A0A1J4JMR3_9EUKA|nr:hypothetical protein TRFO_33445 [Tritrichomonas foetus]|eukprot:OHS99985.1 hypothetical protein TRFO_33445 [Tritrichomonas foetus]
MLTFSIIYLLNLCDSMIKRLKFSQKARIFRRFSYSLDMPRGVLKVSSELREYVLDDLSQFILETDVKKGKILDLIKGSVLNTNRFVHVIQVPDKRPDKEAIDFFIDTIKIYYYLSHPFIEKLLGFTKSYKLSIVTENSHLTLKKFLNDEKSISGTILNKIVMGIAFGMRYMHMNRYIHCKLSPHTIYLTDEKSPKISHLEISHSFDKSPSLRSIPTHLNYVAPEYMDTNSSYNEKVDVYSYGMILYEMTTGKVPYCDVPSNQLLTQIRDGKKPSLKKAPKTIKSLIEECWSNDPQSRPSFDTIFNKFKNRNVMFNKVDDKEFSRFLNEINNSIDLPIKEKPYIKYTGEYLNKKDNQRNKNDDYEYDDDDYDDDSHEKRNRNKNRNRSRKNRRRNSDYESFGMHSRNKSSFTDSENSADDDSDKYYREKKEKRKPGPFDSPNSGYKMRTVWKGNENYQKKNRKYLSDNDISDDNHVDLNKKRNKRFIFSDDENSSDEENYQRKRKVNPFDSPVNGYKMKTVCRKDQTSYDPTVTSQKMFKKPKNTNFSMRTVFRHNSIPDPVIKRIDNDTKINSESSNDDDGDDDSIDKYVKVKKMLKKPKNKKNYIKKEVVYTSSSDDDIERIIIKKIKKKKKKRRPQQIIEIQYSSEYEEEEEKIQKIIKKIKKKKKPKLVEKEPQKTIKSPKVTKSPHNMNKKISISSSSVDSISDQIPKYQTDQEDDSNGKYVKIKTQPKIKKNYIEKNIPIIKESKPNKKMKSIFTVSDFLKPKYKNDDNIKPLNLNIIANLSHPKFEKELSEAETRLKPSQYDDFFFIIINHLKSKIDYHIIKKLLKVVILILTTEEAFDSLCKSGLILFLPYKENVINYTFKVLELLFQFRPNSFQDNFEPRMTQLTIIQNHV